MTSLHRLDVHRQHSTCIGMLCPPESDTVSTSSIKSTGICPHWKMTKCDEDKGKNEHRGEYNVSLTNETLGIMNIIISSSFTFDMRDFLSTSSTIHVSIEFFQENEVRGPRLWIGTRLVASNSCISFYRSMILFLTRSLGFALSPFGWHVAGFFRSLLLHI